MEFSFIKQEKSSSFIFLLLGILFSINVAAFPSNYERASDSEIENFLNEAARTKLSKTDPRWNVLRGELMKRDAVIRKIFSENNLLEVQLYAGKMVSYSSRATLDPHLPVTRGKRRGQEALFSAFQAVQDRDVKVNLLSACVILGEDSKKGRSFIDLSDEMVKEFRSFLIENQDYFNGVDNSKYVNFATRMLEEFKRVPPSGLLGCLLNIF